jgi:multiple sugar transport system permease protein
VATVSERLDERGGLADWLLDTFGSYQGVAFLLPTFILLTFIVFYPMFFNGILLSFQDYTLNPDVPNPWVGLRNYQYWLLGAGQALFLFSIKMTLMYEFIVIPLDLLMALGAALVLNETLPARPLWRGIMLIGYAAPPVAAGLTFAFMEQAAVYGVIYKIVNAIFNVPEQGGMIANTPWAFWGVIIAKVWRDFGFMYVVFLAGVQSIPRELYEIAKVDGAGPLQRFRYITLPHLRTIIVTVVMIRTVFTIGKIDIPWAITRGGPTNQTTFWGILIFKEGFIERSLAQAAALGIMLAIVVIPLIIVWVRSETEDTA